MSYEDFKSLVDEARQEASDPQLKVLLFHVPRVVELMNKANLHDFLPSPIFYCKLFNSRILRQSTHVEGTED